MEAMQLRERIEVANELGECVLWDGATGSLWWTDIEGRRLYRLDWSSRSLKVVATPHRLAAFAFADTGPKLVAAFDGALARFDPETGAVGDILRPPGLGERQRLNDGRVDRQGRFWIGGMVEDPARPSAARLYRIGQGRIEPQLDGLGIANGLCWSPDGTVCYFADSRQKVIWRFAFDPDRGTLSDRQEFARPPAGAPDGATVDAEGYVWSALWGGGSVVRYAPDGRLDRVVTVPVSQPTCVAFGGPELDLLFVTSAATGLGGSETGAGDLFVYNAQVRGLPESRFKSDGWPL